MKLLIILISLLHTSFLVCAQDMLSGVKAQIINEIVQKAAKPEKDQKVVVVADLESREMITSTGVAGTYIKYLDEKFDDSVAIKKLRDSFFVNMGKRFTFKSFKEIQFDNRNEVVKKYLEREVDFSKISIYVEIAAPLGGWEVGSLFLKDKSFFNEERYMRFQMPRFCIPVFILRSNQSKQIEEKKSFLFRYDLIFSNDQLSVKLVDWKEI